MFFKEYIGEPILLHFISYPDKKTKHSIETNHLRHQPDRTTPKKFKYLKNMALVLTMLDCLYF